MENRYVVIDGIEHQVSGTGEAIHLDGEACQKVIPLGNGAYSVLLGNESVRVVLVPGADGLEAICGGVVGKPVVETERSRLLKRFGGGRGDRERKSEIHAPMPALVVRVEVSVGQEISTGDGLIVLEAMKMENELRAQHAGVVKEIFVEKGMTVEKGALLIRLE